MNTVFMTKLSITLGVVLALVLIGVVTKAIINYHLDNGTFYEFRERLKNIVIYGTGIVLFCNLVLLIWSYPM